MKKWIVLGVVSTALALDAKASERSLDSIPLVYHGNFSGDLKYCGMDSDQNWSISKDRIDAWEMHYEIKIIRNHEKKLYINAIHKEYGYEKPVNITLEIKNKDVLFIENICEKKVCWSVKLHRCP